MLTIKTSMADFIDTIVLGPYSNENLIVIKGYSYDEVVEWYKGLFEKTDEKKLSEIKKHFAWYHEHLEFFKEIKSSLDEKIGEASSAQGTYYTKNLVSYPGSKIRAIVLRKDLKPSNPDNVITIAHEVLHLCQEYLPKFLNRDEEHEAEAYFHTHVMTRIVGLFG